MQVSILVDIHDLTSNNSKVKYRQAFIKMI